MCVSCARVGQAAGTTLAAHTEAAPALEGAVQGAARAAALRSPPWHWGVNPQRPPCSCLQISECDHLFKGSGTASPPRGASRLCGDRAREVEATDKAWEGRRKDQSQPAELQGLKIAAALAWHCVAERSLLVHPCANVLVFFQFSLQEGLEASGKAPL